MEPTYPQGTPEYEAYAAELRTELGKFARGEDPYPYRREEVAMPTVPNWIAKAVVFTPGYGTSAGHTELTLGWHATQTQVIVKVNASRGPAERRFRLSDLSLIGDTGMLRTRLAAPDDPEVMAALRHQAVTRARIDVLNVVERKRLQDGTDDAEATIRSLMTIRAEVDKAIADLCQVL